MANSCKVGVAGFDPAAPWQRRIGPLCMSGGYSSVDFNSGGRDTPGTLGFGDWGDSDNVCWLAAESSSAPFKLPPATPDPNLSVSEGQLTFSAEGNDDPGSLYFSRHIHWPGGESGVTLGRGYDMRKREEADVKKDLIAAGIAASLAAEFAKGAEKTGAEAKIFVAENQTKLGVIDTEIQKKLFENIYPGYVKTARRIYDKRTHDEPDRVAWDKLSQAIKDVLVDFAYQGFSGWPEAMEEGMNNDSEELIDYIKSSPRTKPYETGRGRAKYLKKYGAV